MRVRRPLLPLVAAAALAVPAVAAAQQRVAAPTGTGSACTPASPCDIATAVNDASDGDEVVVTGGRYEGAALPTDFTISASNLTVRGDETGPPPVLAFAPGGGPRMQFNANSALRHLRIELSTPDLGGASPAIWVLGDGFRLEGVALTTDGYSPLVFSGGTTGHVVRSSIVATTAPGAYALIVPDGGAVRLDAATIVATDTTDGVALGVLGTGAATVTNTIVSGGRMDVSAAAGASVAVSGSNVRRSKSEGPVRFGTGIQEASPWFADAAGGDFHQAQGSVTIDAGDASSGVAGDGRDVDGDARVIRGVQDIGADETTATGPNSPPPAPARDTTAPVLARVALARATVRRGARAQVRSSLSEPMRVTVRVERLTPGRRAAGRCRAAARSGPGCVVRVRVGTIAGGVRGPGAIRVTVGPRIAGRLLAPGRYALTLTAVDAAGNRAAPRAVVLTVMR